MNKFESGTRVRVIRMNKMRVIDTVEGRVLCEWEHKGKKPRAWFDEFTLQQINLNAIAPVVMA